MYSEKQGNSPSRFSSGSVEPSGAVIKAQKLSLFVDLQEPPLGVIIYSKVDRAKTDSSFLRKLQDSFFNFRRRSDGFHLNVAQPCVLSPIESFPGIVQSK